MLNKKFIGVGIGILIIVITIFLGLQFLDNPIKEYEKSTKVENHTEIKIAGEDKIEIDPNLPLTEKDIDTKLNEIETNAKNNTYTPKPREWITSGPFQIDRTEYVLGEKIFFTAKGLSPNEKGQIAFLRPLNDTHYSVYFTVPFDGMQKSTFNYYFEPRLSANTNICTKDQLVGKWVATFRGTNYPNLYFEIKDQILPGAEDTFSPKC